MTRGNVTDTTQKWQISKNSKNDSRKLLKTGTVTLRKNWNCHIKEGNIGYIWICFWMIHAKYITVICLIYFPIVLTKPELFQDKIVSINVNTLYKQNHIKCIIKFSLYNKESNCKFISVFFYINKLDLKKKCFSTHMHFTTNFWVVTARNVKVYAYS